MACLVCHTSDFHSSNDKVLTAVIETIHEMGRGTCKELIYMDSTELCMMIIISSRKLNHPL